MTASRPDKATRPQPDKGLVMIAILERGGETGETSWRGSMIKQLGKFVGAIATSAVLAACSMFTPTLVEQGIVKFEIQKSSPVSITSATAYREGNETVIRGIAAFPSTVCCGHFTGDIDVDIRLPDGEVVKKHDVPLRCMRVPKQRGRRAFFVIRLDREFSKGTVIRVAYREHRSDRTNQTTEERLNRTAPCDVFNRTSRLRALAPQLTELHENDVHLGL